MDGREFTAYGASHLGAVIVLALGIVVLRAVGRRLQDPRDRVGKVLAVFLVVAVVPLQVLYFTPGHWNPERTLPVQLCDVAAVVAVVALWTHHRWAVALTYFWGITLTTQAIITPDLSTDFPDLTFLLFWVMHIGTVWAAVHLTWTRGIHPDWCRYGVAIAVTAVWAVSVFCLNLAIGSNYGYLNAKPSAATALDLLGPWPWYVVAEVALISTVWALMTWPWVRRGQRTTSDLTRLPAAEATIRDPTPRLRSFVTHGDEAASVPSARTAATGPVIPARRPRRPRRSTAWWRWR